jgi:hypothetical protein
LKEEHRISQIQPELRKVLSASRKKLLITVACAFVACTIVTILTQTMEYSVTVSGGLALITAGSALALSLKVISRQKVRGLFPRLYASLGLTLGLWFAAEAIWVYYEVGLAIETPFPSIADVLWLGGYVPFFYFLWGILKNFLGLSRSLIFPLLPIGAVGFVLLGNVLLSIYQDADLASESGVVSYVVASAYPVADMFIIIPAVAAFVQLRKGLLTFTPWLLIVIATIAFIAGDIGFAYSALITEKEDLVWVWNPLYNLAYIAIASSLIWHKSFFTVDEKKELRIWQERNK